MLRATSQHAINLGVPHTHDGPRSMDRRTPCEVWNRVCSRSHLQMRRFSSRCHENKTCMADWKIPPFTYDLLRKVLWLTKKGKVRFKHFSKPRERSGENGIGIQGRIIITGL